MSSHLESLPKAERSVSSDPETSDSVGDTSAFANIVCASPFPLTEISTQVGSDGILYDANDGVRAAPAERAEGTCPRIRLTKLDTGDLVFDVDLKGARANSTKRYDVRFHREMWLVDADLNFTVEPCSVFDHSLDLSDRNVLIHRLPGMVDETGISLMEAARYLRQREFKVDLLCGLFSQASAAGATCVLRSGFSLPSTEFCISYASSTGIRAMAAGNNRRSGLRVRTSYGARAVRTRRVSSSARRKSSAGVVIRMIKTIPTFADESVRHCNAY